MANYSTINPLKNQSKRCYPPTPHPKSGLRLSKKSKTSDALDNVTVPAHESNKVPFQRIWSESQEIALLTALLHFKQIDKATGPVPDPVFDLDFTEESLKLLNSEFTKKQVKNKMWMMRGKYGKNAAMENEGKGLSFASAHNARVYQLSKQIWGGGGEGESEASFSIAKVLSWIRRVTEKDACEADKEKQTVISETPEETVFVNRGSGSGVGNASGATKKDETQTKGVPRGLIVKREVEVEEGANPVTAVVKRFSEGEGKSKAMENVIQTKGEASGSLDCKNLLFVKKESETEGNPAPIGVGLGQIGGHTGPLLIKGDILNYGLEYLKDSQRNNLAKMWENLGVCEYLLEKKRAKLIKKHMGMVWKAMESSGKLDFTKQT